MVKLQNAVYYVDGQHTKVYSVSDKSIAIPSNLTFDMSGSTLIQIPNDKDGYAIFTIIGSSNVTLKNGILIGDINEHIYTGAPDRTHEFGFGIDIRGASNVTVTGMDIYNMTGDSILIGGKDAAIANGGTISQGITVSNCKLHDNRRQGVSVMGAKNVLINGCTIYGIGKNKGTLPSSGIDLENELDWPIDKVTISNNTFYNNANGALLVHRGAKNTLVQQNSIDGYIALVYGAYTNINNNKINNGGIFAIDTDAPIFTYISKNTLVNSNIEILRNKGVIIRENTIKEGVIKLNYSYGAIYKNQISNSRYKAFAIQVYDDSQAKGITFNVYLNGNVTTGKYLKALSVSKYSGLKVFYTETDIKKYIANFENSVTINNEPVPQSGIQLKPNYFAWIAAIAGIVAVVAFVVWRLIKRKKTQL